MSLLLLLLLLVTPILPDIVTFASVTIITILKATTINNTFCITGESDSVLQDNFVIKSLLSDPQNKTVAKDVAQKIKKFYFGDKQNSAAVFLSTADVRNSFLSC